MSPYLLLLINAFVIAGQALFFKAFSSGYRRGYASHFLYNVFLLGIVILIFLAANGFVKAENPYTYLYSTAFGVVWVMATLFVVIAMSMGPTGLVTLFFSFGIIIPIIADLTVLGTLINVFQIVGLILLFTSFYIGNLPSGKEKGKISPRFIITCIASFVFNGSIMTSAKLHQGVMPGVDIEAFLLYGFLVSLIMAAVCFAFFHIKETKKDNVIKGNADISYGYMFKAPKYYFIAIGSGATTAVANLLMLIVAGQVPAAIQFPLMNGGSSIITAILSVFIFKEGLTKKTVVVFIIGIAALAIINM